MNFNFFWPMFAMVLLTILVSMKLLRDRIREMKGRRIHPQKVPLRAAMASALEDTGAADNYANLFESPVLFYIGMLVAIVLPINDPLLWYAAWGFVLFRIVHSAIHVTYNRVMHRFGAFLGAMALLWLIWFRLAWLIYSANH